MEQDDEELIVLEVECYDINEGVVFTLEIEGPVYDIDEMREALEKKMGPNFEIEIRPKEKRTIH